ncbi:hypothetical protein IscW_ISCW014746, partial [Ixodes scapularis]
SAFRRPQPLTQSRVGAHVSRERPKTIAPHQEPRRGAEDGPQSERGTQKERETKQPRARAKQLSSHGAKQKQGPATTDSAVEGWGDRPETAQTRSSRGSAAALEAMAISDRRADESSLDLLRRLASIISYQIEIPYDPSDPSPRRDSRAMKGSRDLRTIPASRI